MADPADPLRGMGLTLADRALEILLNSPQKLDRARSRFSRPPPSYISYPSGTTTQLQSPDRPDEEERWLSERRFQLTRQYRASFPYSQFEAQVEEEGRQINKGEDSDGCHAPIRMGHTTHARECVKKRWIEQGIWDEKWEQGGEIWRWKHEEPLESKPELHTELKTTNANPFSPSHLMKTSELETDEGPGNEEIQLIEKVWATKEREREASRPFHQFVYQLSKERERIQQELRRDGNPTADPFDINTTAYERVKDTWTKSGIWDNKWGFVPGMSWKHEQPLEEWIEQEMSKVTYPHQRSPERDGPVNFSETDLRQYRSVSPSPAKPNQEVSSVTNPAQQELPMAINAPKPPNAFHSSSSRCTAQPLPREKRRPGRPSRGSEKARPDLPPHDSPVPLRRSKRLQEAKPVTGPDTVAGSRGPANCRGRAKHGGTKADISAKAVPARDSRASKRLNLKQKRAHK
ncbi:hypothetical protein F5B21DRAFT_497439 [Xylaria acuta]|nr:hypothetical protein F5B21DRAFT_497439 [Xylaria acuta]